MPDRPTNVDEYTEWNARALGRQAVSRRSILKAVAAGAGGIAVAQFMIADAAFTASGGQIGGAGVVVSGRHLSFVQDAHAGPATAMAVTAQLVSKTGTLPPTLRAYVDVGDQRGDYGQQVEADIVHLTGQYAIPGGPVSSQYYAKARITGLRPGTVHHYRFRLSDGTTSGDAYFTTAPASLTHEPVAPFTFTAFADVGTDNAPTDPKIAWGQDPAAVRATGGKWPAGPFDNRYSPTDPVAGLHGTDPTPARTMSRGMSAQRPRFTLLAGDICYADPSGNGLPADDSTALRGGAPPGKNLFNPYVWDVFFTQIEPQAAFTPWMFTTGNHDMEALYSDTRAIGDSPTHGYAGHVKRLDLPGNGPKGCPSVYSFVYGNVAVISLDANEVSAEIQTNAGYSHNTQVHWLRDTLRRLRTDATVAPSIDFIVVFFHHCAFSTTAGHASDGGVRATLEPLLSYYQVDLVVQGHNHVLERTDPIRNGKPTKHAPDYSVISPATDGVTYMCVGSGGRPRTHFQPAPSASAPPPTGVTPFGPQALPAGQRYRGYWPPGGANARENNTENVVNSHVWSFDNSKVTAAGFRQGTRVPEQVTWSQVRYDGYAYIAVDVVPAKRGTHTTMTIRTLADALPGSTSPFTEIDRITLRRMAGAVDLKLR